MCGIWAFLGLNAGNYVVKLAPWLIHRGQEGVSFVCHVDGSLVRLSDVSTISSTLCLGHARYSTSGPYGVELQPIVLGNDFALVFNGTISNYVELISKLRDFGIGIRTNYDALVLAHYMRELLSRRGIDDGISELFHTLRGGYSIIAIWRDSLIVIRDPWGIRPLVIGSDGNGIAIASESAALEALGMTWREVEPGKALALHGSGREHWVEGPRVRRAYCALEYIYFLRPDSHFNGISVYDARRKLGMVLAHKEGNHDIDIVTPVPETARIAAEAYAEGIGKPIHELIIKNRYVGRSFIKPPRERSVNMYNVIRDIVKGRSISLVDDSIIRGDTFRKVLPRFRRSGTRAIHVRVSSPPIRYPCFMGMDFPTRRELVAHGRSIDEVRGYLGADSLVYLTVDELMDSIGTTELCTACFTGNYPFTINIDESEKAFSGDRVWESQAL
ncbi:amidophosphoribosyltransferase [Vulcanisaeta moutnovskia 768-28]|uniref:Amidophosphoribosyltransferase n=1 Tax=Vulcanisaeta moutnovskia (strain 768-28) TaxID=985053 RepID=F0QVW3_VULM7|nr:amidophosphoribosyltransferase [Vulcanisaeta moutnovskia]ADY02137.1 amidophosphoribosyltransferase [Vulcanisaeta moutnovskia 768-28]